MPAEVKVAAGVRVAEARAAEEPALAALKAHADARVVVMSSPISWGCHATSPSARNAEW